MPKHSPASHPPRVELWGRTHDAARFHPGRRRAESRANAASNGGILIGYLFLRRDIVSLEARETPREAFENVASRPRV